MKTSRTILNILLVISVVMLAYFLITSVTTPIHFENTRAEREVAVTKNLLAIRIGVTEFKNVKGYYSNDLDSLVLFLRNTPKKEVLKEGSLTDKQLEAGLTEKKAVKILNDAKVKALREARKKGTEFADDAALYAYVWANDKEVIKNGLQGFRRDTILENMIATLYKGQYNEETIGDIIYIPYSNGKKFEVETNNSYTTSQGIHVPLIEVRAPFESYLGDQNAQELVNLIDKEQKLDHYAGLKIGDVYAPNNNAGNWE